MSGTTSENIGHHDPARPQEPSTAAAAAVTPSWAERFLQVTAALLAAAALAWLGCLLSGHRPPGAQWAMETMVAGGVVVAGVWASLWCRRFWRRPCEALVRLLPQVRAGEAPIEALCDICGGPAPLVPLLQDLLRDIRRQRAEIAHLNHEMGQRVAMRTDALERRLGSLREQAARDPLTGLYNRRMLDEHLPRLIERRKADRQALSLLMIDVDNFKLLNDTLGHAAGDDLLRSIGQLIRSTIRDNDLAFRCGGDEFVVILDACDADSAARLTSRLTDLVDALVKPLKLVKPPRLSIGISQLSELHEPTPAAMLEQADRQLYDVKTQRRAARPGRVSA